MLRIFILLLAVSGAIVLFFSPLISQDPAYHHFTFPMGDILSSLIYLPVGIWGLFVSQKLKEKIPRALWALFYISVCFIALGSFFYHLSPSNTRLAFDRFAMAIAFMSLFSLILGEIFSWKLARKLAPWLLGLGAFSIFYWVILGDLRIYVWVQFVPFFALLLLSLRHEGEKKALLLGAWLSYLLAKLCEIHDASIARSLPISGHTLKHLFSVVGVVALIFYVRASAKRDGSQTRSKPRRKTRG